MTRRRDKEKDGWGGFGGYMSAKVQKLDNQFEQDHQKTSQNTSIFSGISIFVNGHTDPSADELKKLMQQHGGRYVHYYNRTKVTHIVAQNLPVSKQRQLREEKVVSPKWVADSVAAGALLPWTQYQLYAIRERNQQGLDTFLKPNEKTDQCANNDETANNGRTNGHDVHEVEADSSEHNIDIDSEPEATSPSKRKSPDHVLRAGERGFLSEFYARSRLHHLSSWGAEFKDYVNGLRADSDGTFPSREVLKSCRTSEDEAIVTSLEGRRIIMHIDMDCFFVSVGLRNRPDLKGKPVAVTHSKGGGHEGDKERPSMSEIASCSYEARASGVRNGMFLGRAKELCPNLVTIPYDFDGYKSVSQILYDTIAKYTLDIEAVSCDELFVDCTSLLKSACLAPLTVGCFIRKEIHDSTSCTASCGFGPNLLLARMATRKAKPDGMYWIREDQVMQEMEKFSVRDLPGVGPSLSRRLGTLGCENCGDVQKLTLSTLQREFGSKSGHTLFQLCRGVDNTPVQSYHERKSISAEVNYGIRFKSSDEFETFLNELANELSHRMKRCRVKGRTITLKLMIRRPDQPVETSKFMGHGICKNIAKSVTLPVPTDDPRLIGQEIVSIVRQFSVIPEDVRGIGIQMHKLDSQQKEKRNMSLISFVKKSSDQTETFSRNNHSTPKIDRKHIIETETGDNMQHFLQESTGLPINQAEDQPQRDVLFDDLPNYSQINSSFLDAMPDDIREELGQMLPSRKKENKEREAQHQPMMVSPVKNRNLSPTKAQNRSPNKRGRGRGRGVKAESGVHHQLKLTSMIMDKPKLVVNKPNENQSEPLKVDANPKNGIAVEKKQTPTIEEENPDFDEPSLFGAKTIEEIRIILKDWVEVEPEPLSKDVTYFQSFLLACLPRNLELLCQTLSFFCSLCSDLPWVQTYERVENAVQSEMVIAYGGPLKLSAIRQFCELPDT